MTVTEGFERVKTQYIKELRTEAHFFRHVRTGAELLSLVNDDENKVFGITFRTPPRDSSGIAHILEHSVLCGSRKYRVKEPFVELLKGSLKTFLNAFTYPDKTCYPVASQNTQDFYNLIDVYLDAVFYPRLTPHILEQEGWHFEMDHPEGPLQYKGVVFNEMKGAYSSPDNVLSEYSQQSLFPDTTYGFDSGGDPKHIIGLTFEEFLSFHRRYYHPSNARIFFHGDDDPQNRLRLVNEYLKDFDRIEVDSAVPLQPPFESPRRLERPFAAPREDTASGENKLKGMLTMNWALTETTDAERNFALQVLHHILLGMPGSPLRKALIDSGLGDDLAGGGLERELRQMTFSTGLKGIRLEDAERVECLILETLEKLRKDGIDPLTVEAAVNTVEFRLRENHGGGYPRGLNLMLRSLTTWLYDADPLVLLAFEQPFESLKSRIASDGRFFENMIDDLFLRNTHRTTLILKPDPDLTLREEEAERAQLDAIRAKMTPEQRQQVVENARQLKRLQELPDPPEALAAIPTLRRSDLDPHNKIIPQTFIEMAGVPVAYHDIFTNGILYTDIGFDLHSLDQSHLPYVPLFARALLEIGTTREDFVALSQRIGRKTGGIYPDIFTASLKNRDQSSAWMFLRGKSMLQRSGDLFAILRDILLDVRLDNRERFLQMALEEKARQEQKLVPGGHQMVNLRIRSHFSEADWVAEQLGGVSYLQFLRGFIQQVETDWPGVLGVLEAMRQALINRSHMVVNITVDERSWLQIEGLVADFLQRLPSTPAPKAAWVPQHPARHEAMIIPAQVNYVGKGANLYQLGYTFHGSAQVITGYLRTSWLWERIRVQGGAYGAFCMFDRMSGTFTFVSYRDPNTMKTLDNFDQSAEFLKALELSESELTKAIIGAIGTLDTHLLPDAQGFVALLRHLSGETDEDRQLLRDQVLATGADHFRAFAGVLEQINHDGIVKILGHETALRELDETRPGWLDSFRVL